MKKLLTAVAALLFNFCALAQGGGKATIIKKLKTENSITALVINDGIRVVLMNDPGNDLMIEGAAAAVEDVAVSSSKGEIIISHIEGAARPAVVYIPANFLKKILINGPSMVSSYQPISITRLDITVAGECDLKIHVTGKIYVTAAEDYKFVYTAKSVTR